MPNQRPDTATGHVRAPIPGGSDADTTTSPSLVPGTPVPETPPLAHRDQWAHLTLVAEIGRGGYGRVYRAWDPALAREVALKIVRLPSAAQASVAAMLREGRMLARVRHQNVVTVHGAQQVGDEIGIWMELVRGRSLAEIVRQDGPLGGEEAAVAAVGLCRALAAVHGEGLVHRDVKAQNVMREAGGRIVLMDFGTGRDLGGGGHTDAVGTPLYMAPEVLAGSPASPASDIYSAGVVMFHLVTGDYPTDGGSMVDLVVAHGLGQRKLLVDCRPDLPERFIRIVERALAPRPEDRYATAGAMLRDLVELTPMADAHGAAGPIQTPSRVLPTNSPSDRPVRHEARYTPRRLPSARLDARRRTSPLGAALLGFAVGTPGLLALVVGLGWLCSTAFNTTLDRPEAFAHETLSGYMRWALKSLIAPTFYVLVAAAPFALAAATWRLTRTMSARAGSLSHRLELRLAAFFAVEGRMQLVGMALVTAHVVGLALVLWTFADLVQGFTSIVSVDDPSVFAPLAPAAAGTRQAYRAALAVLAFLSFASWVWVLRRWPFGTLAGGGVVTQVTGFVLVLVTVVMMTVPYRTFSHSEFERTRYDGQRCYVLGEQLDNRLLYCPDAPVPRNRIVRKDDPKLERSDVTVIESVFTPAATAAGRGR